MRIRRLLLCTALAVCACSHEQPFETPETSSNQPFLPGTPTRLTYNPGKDLRPAWSPDGGSFFYAWQQLGTANYDRCLGEMPASGGSNLETICNPNPAAADSADAFDAPSPSADGRLLYMRSSSRAGAVNPNTSGVFIGPLTAPLNASQLLTLPYTIPGGRTHASISNARWLSETRIVYVGESVNYPRACSNCPPDTLVTGLEVVALDMSGPQPVLSVMPSTNGATSVAVTATRDTLYYTLQNDSRVYRVALVNGQQTLAHDFGALGIARDVTVRDGQLVAVVGGVVTYTDDPLFGPIQRDQGGVLISVDLATGDESVLPTDRLLLFRRPAFSPGGTSQRLVAEGYEFSVTPPPSVDTTVSKNGDLYLYEAP